jgi:hypothetical protein
MVSATSKGSVLIRATRTVMAKQPPSSDKAKKVSTPPVFSPAVIRVPVEEFRITDAQFGELEGAGGITLSEIQRTELVTLAIFWIDDLRMRVSARPKQFRECLDEIEKAFASVERACQWDRHPQYALVHWAMETSVKGAEALPVKLSAFELEAKNFRETILALKQCLPPDPGRQRPFDDEGRIFLLAEIFEKAGGKATAYSSAYAEKGGVADTPFRKFAQQFYLLLPADNKRDPGGFDEALRLAMMARPGKTEP